MTDFLDPLLDPAFKGFPHGSRPVRRSEVGAQGWNVLDGDLPFPVAVLRRAALDRNLGWMQAFADERGLRLSPHGKTTMSPQLFGEQLEAGAWGITVANVTQMRPALAAGARNVVIANQLLDAADLGAVAAQRAAQPALRVLFLLDSLAQLALIEETSPDQPFEVLLELGIPGGRTGCRTLEQALAVARAARASKAVALVGVECFEGLGHKVDDEADGRQVDDFLGRVEAAALACDAEGLFEGEEVIVSAGGSGVYDLVAPRLRPALSRPVTGLLRSGCYLTHDHGQYKRLIGAIERRLGCAEGESLKPALEVWARVQSLPEPGLALLTAGKRDVSHDLGLPVPIASVARASRTPRPAPADWVVDKLNDQHAYLRVGPDHGLKVGDLVALGISHPCTTFDKWRWMPVVDEGYDVVDAIVTWF